MFLLQISNRFVAVVPFGPQDVELVSQVQLMRTEALEEQFAGRQFVAVAEGEAADDVHSEVDSEVGHDPVTGAPAVFLLVLGHPRQRDVPAPEVRLQQERRLHDEISVVLQSPVVSAVYVHRSEQRHAYHVLRLRLLRFPLDVGLSDVAVTGSHKPSGA